MYPFTNFDASREVAKDITQLIGNTPCLYLNKINTTKASIIVKMECENPMASVKDRLAIAIIQKAEEEGKLVRGESVIVEATSGNTGIGLGHIGAVLGYKVIITMPESMSIERRCLLGIFGAELHLTPAAAGMKGAVNLAEKIIRENPKAVLADQFNSKYNAQVHEETTGPEIWQQTGGKVDVFIAGAGTGGTVTGVARFLRRKNPMVHIVVVEPAESAVLSGGKPGPHKIQGIGAGFVPGVLDMSVVDEVFTVPSDRAIEMSRKLAQTEGIFCGLSSGANVYAALQIAKRPLYAGRHIVTMIPSFGERYLSTVLFQDIQEKMKNLPVDVI